MGIAHTLAKPVLILSRQASDIPVDLAHKISTAIAAIVKDYGLTTQELRSEIIPV